MENLNNLENTIVEVPAYFKGSRDIFSKKQSKHYLVYEFFTRSKNMRDFSFILETEKKIDVPELAPFSKVLLKIDITNPQYPILLDIIS